MHVGLPEPLLILQIHTCSCISSSATSCQPSLAASVLVVAVFFVRFLLRQPDLDGHDLGLWKFAAIGAAVGFVVTCVVLAG